jgi:hypothetical protein
MQVLDAHAAIATLEVNNATVQTLSVSGYKKTPVPIWDACAVRMNVFVNKHRRSPSIVFTDCSLHRDDVRSSLKVKNT